MEAIAQHLIRNIVLTIENPPFFSINGIGILVINILHNRFDSWELLDQLLDQLVHTKHLRTSGDQNDHDFSRMMSSTNHKVTNQARLFLLIIRLEVKPTNQITKCQDHLVDDGILDIKVFNRHQIMGVLPKEACFDLTIDTTNRDLGLVAVLDRMVHSQGKGHLDISDSRHLVEAILDLLGLEFQLLGIS